MEFTVNNRSFEILEMNGYYRAYLLGYARTRRNLIGKHESEKYVISLCVELSEKLESVENTREVIN